MGGNVKPMLQCKTPPKRVSPHHLITWSQVLCAALTSTCIILFPCIDHRGIKALLDRRTSKDKTLLLNNLEVTWFKKKKIKLNILPSPSTKKRYPQNYIRAMNSYHKSKINTPCPPWICFLKTFSFQCTNPPHPFSHRSTQSQSLHTTIPRDFQTLPGEKKQIARRCECRRQGKRVGRGLIPLLPHPAQETAEQHLGVLEEGEG